MKSATGYKELRARGGKVEDGLAHLLPFLYNLGWALAIHYVVFGSRKGGVACDQNLLSWVYSWV